MSVLAAAIPLSAMLAWCGVAWVRRRAETLRLASCNLGFDLLQPEQVHGHMHSTRGGDVVQFAQRDKRIHSGLAVLVVDWV